MTIGLSDYDNTQEEVTNLFRRTYIRESPSTSCGVLAAADNVFTKLNATEIDYADNLHTLLTTGTADDVPATGTVTLTGGNYVELGPEGLRVDFGSEETAGVTQELIDTVKEYTHINTFNLVADNASPQTSANKTAVTGGNNEALKVIDQKLCDIVIVDCNTKEVFGFNLHRASSLKSTMNKRPNSIAMAFNKEYSTKTNAYQDYVWGYTLAGAENPN